MGAPTIGWSGKTLLTTSEKSYKIFLRRGQFISLSFRTSQVFSLSSFFKEFISSEVEKGKSSAMIPSLIMSVHDKRKSLHESDEIRASRVQLLPVLGLNALRRTVPSHARLEPFAATILDLLVWSKSRPCCSTLSSDMRLFEAPVSGSTENSKCFCTVGRPPKPRFAKRMWSFGVFSPGVGPSKQISVVWMTPTCAGGGDGASHVDPSLEELAGFSWAVLTAALALSLPFHGPPFPFCPLLPDLALDLQACGK